MSSPNRQLLTGWRDLERKIDLTVVVRSNLITVQVADTTKFAILAAGNSPDDRRLLDTINREGLLRGRDDKWALESPDNRHPRAGRLVVVVPRGSSITFENRGNLTFDGWINPETLKKRSPDELVSANVKLLVEGGRPSVRGLMGTLDAWTPGGELDAEVFGQASLHPSKGSIATVSGAGKRLCHAITEDSQVALWPGDLDVTVHPDSMGEARVRRLSDGRSPTVDTGTLLAPGTRYLVDADGAVSVPVPVNQLAAVLGAGLGSTANSGKGTGQRPEGRPASVTRTGPVSETGGPSV